MNLSKSTIVLGVVLFVSLVGNLFMGGMLLGHRFGFDPPPRGEWKERVSQLRQHLSEKDEKILRESMRDNQKKFEEMRHDLEDIRQDIKAASHAEPFDQSVLDSSLKEEKEKKLEILHLMQETRKEVMHKLSPEGVAILQNMAPPPRFSVRRTTVRVPGSEHPGDIPFVWEEAQSGREP